jgi:hypothetical protein
MQEAVTFYAKDDGFPSPGNHHFVQHAFSFDIGQFTNVMHLEVSLFLRAIFAFFSK